LWILSLWRVWHASPIPDPAESFYRVIWLDSGELGGSTLVVGDFRDGFRVFNAKPDLGRLRWWPGASPIEVLPYQTLSGWSGRIVAVHIPLWVPAALGLVLAVVSGRLLSRDIREARAAARSGSEVQIDRGDDASRAPSVVRAGPRVGPAPSDHA